MKTDKGQKQAVTLFETISQRLADKLTTKTKSFFLSLIFGALLAVARRRTVKKWLQAAQISDDFRQAFYHMPNIGRKSTILFDGMLDVMLEKLEPGITKAARLRIVLDDSPTKRYGKKIEGAAAVQEIRHHNPTPGRTNAKYCFGHSWVVAVLVVPHQSVNATVADSNHRVCGNT